MAKYDADVIHLFMNKLLLKVSLVQGIQKDMKMNKAWSLISRMTQCIRWMSQETPNAKQYVTCAIWVHAKLGTL